jgi:micrococcal nuclease
MRRLLALCGVLTAVLATATAASPAREGGRVERVVDGDTLVLAGGTRVRLVQIDAPELGSGECYSRAASTELRRLLPAGARVSLVRDPRLDDRDRYGRLLRYVLAGSVNVNLELVRRGAATPWFYDGDRGRYAGALLAAAHQARAARKGLWRACPSTRLDPTRPATTGRSGPPAAPRPAPGGGARACEPSYPDVCIPLYDVVGDLDCADVPYRDFRVRRPDPHGFDGRDTDGRGCES